MTAELLQLLVFVGVLVACGVFAFIQYRKSKATQLVNVGDRRPSDSHPNPARDNVGHLVKDAKESIKQLMDLNDVKVEQCYMRLGKEPGAWELLPTMDPKDGETMIKARIKSTKEPATDLVLAYIGSVNWREEKRLMVLMQYYRRGFRSGLPFGSHLTTTFFGKPPMRYGTFLMMGASHNIWI
jgi:hypothetical protein